MLNGLNIRLLVSIRDNIMIWCVDDDDTIREIEVYTLTQTGFEARGFTDGNSMLETLKTEIPELIVLDIMLPGMDGWQICREIRKNYNTPILMITAKSEVFDKVLGLELGADDYIVKPFDTKEVLARIKAVSRRVGQTTSSSESRELFYDNLHINLTRYVLKVRGKVVETPPKELELLFFLASNPNRVFTRDQLLDEVWGFEYYGDSRTIDVHIKRLRLKLEGVSDKWALKTVWGVGYKFECDEERS